MALPRSVFPKLCSCDKKKREVRPCLTNFFMSETLVPSVPTPTSEKVLANNLLSGASLYTAMFINFIGTLGGEPPHAGSIMFQKFLNREVRHPVQLNEVQEKKVTGGQEAFRGTICTKAQRVISDTVTEPTGTSTLPAGWNFVCEFGK